MVSSWSVTDADEAIQPAADASSRNVRCWGRPYARSTQAGIKAWACAGGKADRYAVGDIPYMRLKLVVNDPTLSRPTAMQMSATDESVIRNKVADRSKRRVSKYACGDSPNAFRNARLK
jgi:hypothetical protein